MMTQKGFFAVLTVLCLSCLTLSLVVVFLFVTLDAGLMWKNGSLILGLPEAPADEPDVGWENPTEEPDPTAEGFPTYPEMQTGVGGSGLVLEIASPPVTPAPQAGAVLTTEEISLRVTPSVVGILGASGDYESEASGSGIIMSADGYIVTNNHVVEGFDKLTVILYDGEQWPALLIGRDRITDLAVIKIEARGLSPAIFGNSDLLAVGERAVCIGNPLGMELSGTLTQGVISAVDRQITVDDLEMTVIQVDAAVNPGNSGGPLINQYGQVVGIISSKIMGGFMQSVEGLGFAIPIVQARPIIDELLSRGYIPGRPAIGITGIDVWPDPELGTPGGMQVISVSEQSGAAGKIIPGDIITVFNGVEVTGRIDINKIKNKLSAGDEVTVTVYRDGRELEFSFALIDESGAQR